MISKVLLFLLSPLMAADLNLVEIWENNRAIEALEQKKALEAHEILSRLVVESPQNPFLQFNLGSSYIAVEDPEKSLKMYQELLKQPNLPEQIAFSSHYNQGVLFATKKEVEKALAAYQKALEIFPNSIETKTNIELLLKMSGGGGQGDKKDQQQDDGEQQNQDENKDSKEPKEFSNKNQQPNQFNDKEMSKEDVNKILEELKKQEQNIRAKHERKGGKESDREKSW